MVCDSGADDNMAGAGRATAVVQNKQKDQRPILLQSLQAYSHLIYLCANAIIARLIYNL